MAPHAQKAPERQQLAGRHRPHAAPPASADRRSTLLYVGFSIAVLALVGVVAYEWQQQKAAPVVAQVPPAVAQKPAEEPAKPVEKPAAIEQPPAASATAQPPAKPAPEKSEAPALPPGTRRLVLRMEEEAWLEVRDGTGRSLVSSLQPAGSERAVRGQPPFQLVIGNAAHVQLIYDGKTVELKPYTRGEVARLTLK